jgi:hypothetical protein
MKCAVQHVLRKPIQHRIFGYSNNSQLLVEQGNGPKKESLHLTKATSLSVYRLSAGGAGTGNGRKEGELNSVRERGWILYASLSRRYLNDFRKPQRGT